ncbi:MAG: hypothetical protein U5N86_12525 [Planctomycetota bacterium]|nr:hypothetical protein [Planctomycetota bacterium]
MVSTYDTEVNCQRFYPATTLFFASQTFDIGRLLKSVGGLFATTVPRKKQRLGEEISNSLTSVGISTGVLARALTDTISVGIAFDTILPEVWATAEIADQDVLESIIAVMEAEETVVRKKRNERDVFFATAPLLELQAGQLKYKVLPAFTIVDGNLVIASSSTSLYRTLSIIAGKEKSLGDDEQFKTALEQAGSNSSFVFARTAMISRKISTLLGSDSGALSFLDEFGEVFWSSATRDLTFLSIKQRTDVPIPVANHLLRPTMLPMTMAALPHYDRFLTMAISSVNWAGSKLYYYDYEHLDIGIDATGEQIAIDAKARVRSLVEDSTGFTFAINPFYEIESVTLDGKKAKWKLTGPFLAVSAPERLAKESVHEVRVVARGMPENLTNLVPPALLKAFRVYSRPVRTDDGLHLSLTSLFYPSPPGLRQDHWTSRTRVTVKKGWEAIANGNLMSVEETGNGVMYTFLDDRPDMLLEVIAGEFERVMDKNANFTVVHYFQPGAIEDKPGMLNFAAECYSYYIDEFGGDFDKMPTIVHMKEQPGISHCNSYIVSYTRRMTTMAHELSHLWWGGLVKVDPLRSSMWYEGMAEYSTLMFIGHKYGQKDYNDYKTYQFNRWHRYDFPPRHYRDIRYWSPGRGIVGYVKGMAYFSGLHGLMGDDKFEEFL